MRVVVTGMGVVAPIGVGLAAFEAGLRAGRSGTGLVARWASGTFPNRVAGEVDDAAVDQTLADLDPADRARLAADRKARFAAAAAREALRDAGPTLFDRTTPFERALSFGPGEDPDCVRGIAEGRPDQAPFDLAGAWAAGRLGFRGPRLVNIGACAAGAMAIGEGFRLIRAGRAPIALVGGHDAVPSPVGVMGFSILGALSARHDDATRASRPFDVTRDGFVPGEGAGMLVLESLDHALARGARIHGELVGYGASCDAYKPTAPEPAGRGAILALSRALAQAGWAPARVGYVNAHGTSTPLNDLTETKALKAVLGDHAYRIPVSSTKSQIGHLVAGAGAVELVACLLAMNGGFVPPTINLATPDPDCDLDYVPNAARDHAFDAFLSNSFAFGGQNACLAGARYVP